MLFPEKIPVNKTTVTYADGTQEQYDSHSAALPTARLASGLTVTAVVSTLCWIKSSLTL